MYLETSDQHKIVNEMDHKSMWRRAQILTYIVSDYSVIQELTNESFGLANSVLCSVAFTPVDLSDLKKRNTQDSKKS